MVEKLEPNEIVSFKELLLTNMIQTDALAQLLIEKGFITLEEYDTKLKQVQYEYMSKQSMKSQ